MAVPRKIAGSVWLLATSWTVRGSNLGGGEIFRTRADRGWSPPSLLYSRHQVILGVERLGRGVNNPTPYSAEVNERGELCLYSLLWVFIACSRVTFTFIKNIAFL